MPKNKIVLGFVFAGLLFLSFSYADFFKKEVLRFSNQSKLFFLNQSTSFVAQIRAHFRQKEQILTLQKEIETLKPHAELSTVFAAKLNQFLSESNLTEFHPSLRLTRAIAYEELGNPYKIWLDLPHYDQNKSYGLIHDGVTAGVVYSKFDQPVGHLQQDKRVVFSVLIGPNRLLGVIFGNEENLLIKYIPEHETVNVGDEVITSGSDNLFYEGIKVGKIIEISTKSIYKIATVKPYMQAIRPNFFYAVDLDVKNPPNNR